MFKKALDLDIDPEFDVYCSSHFISQPGQLAFRALALGYCLSTLFSNFVFNHSFTFFTFFTNLSYILLTCHFGYIVYLSVRYNKPDGYITSKKIHTANILLEIVATNALFLDIVYWGLLYHLSPPLTTMQYFYCVNVHLINLCLILVEVLTTKFHFHPRHTFFTISFLLIYAVFAIVYYIFSHSWIYPILDWHQSMAPVYYTLCFALNVTCFFAMLGISRARERYASCRIARTAYSPASTQENAPLAYASPGHFAKVESPDNSARNYGSMVQYPSLSALTAATSMKTFSSIPPIPPTASAILVGSGAM